IGYGKSFGASVNRFRHVCSSPLAVAPHPPHPAFGTNVVPYDGKGELAPFDVRKSQNRRVAGLLLAGVIRRRYTRGGWLSDGNVAITRTPGSSLASVSNTIPNGASCLDT